MLFSLHFWRCCRSPTASGLAPPARALRFAFSLLFLSSSLRLSLSLLFFSPLLLVVFFFFYQLPAFIHLTLPASISASLIERRAFLCGSTPCLTLPCPVHSESVAPFVSSPLLSFPPPSPPYFLLLVHTPTFPPPASPVLTVTSLSPLQFLCF